MMNHFKDLVIRGIKAKESTKTILAHLAEALDETELYRSKYQTSQVYSPLEELGVKLGNLDLSSRHTRDRVTELDGRLDTSVLFQANLRSRITDLEAKFIKLENPCPQTPTQANPFETEEDCEAELEDPSPAKPSDKPIPPKPNIWCCKDRPFDFTPSDNKWVCTGCKRKFLSRSV